VPERDGILAGLYFLDMMVRLKKEPSELLALLFSKVGPHYLIASINRSPVIVRAANKKS